MSFKGKKNVYTCQECGDAFVTIDRDEGTTPFLTACRRGCKALAQSSFYRVDQSLTPAFEWYRPKPEEVAALSPASRQHVEIGGLLLRPLHTKDYLAGELRKAGLGDMAIKAAQGLYHDFLSPLATPEMQLLADLRAAGTPAALALAERHMRGEFDASKEESDAWAASDDGRAAFEGLTSELRKTLGDPRFNQ